MDTLLLKFRADLEEAMLDLLWRQWCSLGVAGQAGPVTERFLLDPEALLLATTTLGRLEPRLFDEALDWLTSYGQLFNLQRLRNLERSGPLADEPVLGALAAWLGTQGGQPRWKALQSPSRAAGEIQPLFPRLPGPRPRRADETFLAHGLERSHFQPRGLSRPPQPRHLPGLVLILRALVGVSARAEVILGLAGEGSIHASELARLTGHAPRTLQALLQEMVLSGHVLTQEPGASPKVRRGPHRRYFLPRGDWAFLTAGRPMPRWFPWSALYRLVVQTLAAIPAPPASPRHPLLISTDLRAALAVEGEALNRAGLLAALELRPEANGEELLSSLAHRLPQLLQEL